MKRFLLGIFAIIIAVGMSAFTSAGKANLTQYYWYSPDGSTFLGVGDETFPGCPSLNSTDCAKGYTSEPGDPVHDTPQIREGFE